MNERAEYLRKTIEYAVRHPYFQAEKWPDGRPKTKCNLLAKSILSWQGARYLIPDFPMLDFRYDITSMNPGQYLVNIMRLTDTRTAYANVVRMAASGIATEETHDVILPEQASGYPVETDEPTAQEFANQGTVVWMVSSLLAPVGHEAIVCPDEKMYDASKGVFTGQAGLNNGFFYRYQIFGDVPDLKFFVFPKEEQNG
jgi:hypothetical protein